MEKIRLGKTDLMVTRLGFGGIPIQNRSEEEAIRIVSGCLDLGINFFDTSRVYTTSEERIGKALVGRRKEAINCYQNSVANGGKDFRGSHNKPRSAGDRLC